MTSSPTRRPLPPHLKLENPVIDFNALPADAAWWNVDAVLAEPAGALDFMLNNCTANGLIITWRLPVACFLL